MEEFITNDFGINIKKCCASCEMNLGGSDLRYRHTKCPERKVTPLFCCPDWKVRESLLKAGKGGGLIRKPGYLRFIFENGGRTDSLEREWTEKYGSKYINK